MSKNNPVMGLIRGEWFELPKDCGCLPRFHDGPHWLHADVLWHEANKKLLDRNDYMGGIAFCQEEGARLREKRYQMESRGIEEYRWGAESLKVKA